MSAGFPQSNLQSIDLRCLEGIATMNPFAASLDGDVVALLRAAQDDPETVFADLTKKLFGEPDERFMAAMIFMALAPLAELSVPALTAALTEEPNWEGVEYEGELVFALPGLTTRQLVVRTLGFIGSPAAPALERLYELLARARADDPYPGVRAIQVAEAIARIQGPKASELTLDLFTQALNTVGSRNRDDDTVGIATRGAGYLGGAARGILHWLQWMDRESDPVRRFEVACARVRIEGAAALDDPLFRVRGVTDVAKILTGEAQTDNGELDLAEAAAAMTLLGGNLKCIVPTMVRARLVDLTNHPLPIVRERASEALVAIS